MKRPTMYLASLDIKTAFDEAKPKHVAPILDNHNTHGWLIVALLCEMSGLEGKATCEWVESCPQLQQMLTARKRGKPTIVAEDGKPDLGQCGGRMDGEKEGLFSWTWKVKEYIKYAAACGQTTSGSCHTQKNIWSKCYGTSLKKEADGTWYPNMQVCGGQVRMAPSTGCYNFFL